MDKKPTHIAVTHAFAIDRLSESSLETLRFFYALDIPTNAFIREYRD